MVKKGEFIEYGIELGKKIETNSKFDQLKTETMIIIELCEKIRELEKKIEEVRRENGAKNLLK